MRKAHVSARTDPNPVMPLCDVPSYYQSMCLCTVCCAVLGVRGVVPHPCELHKVSLEGNCLATITLPNTFPCLPIEPMSAIWYSVERKDNTNNNR